MSLMRSMLRQALKPSVPDLCAPYRFRSGAYVCTDAEENFPCPPESLLQNGILLKDSRSVVSGFDAEKRFFVKQYKKNGWWRTLKRALQFPRAYRCLAAALRLEELKIETPKVLLASRYCLITEILPSGTVFLSDCPEAAPDAVAFMALLHQSGFYHGDLNLRNLYRTAEGRFGLIDMDSVRLSRKPVSDTVRFLELARLASSYLKSVAAPAEDTAITVKSFAEIYRVSGGGDFFSPVLLTRVRELVARR